MPPAKGEKLTDVLGIANRKDFHIHCARFDGTDKQNPLNPLDAFRDSRKQWQQWNSNAKTENPLKEKYILSLALQDRAKDLWVFCCVFEILDGWKEAHRQGQRWYYETRTVEVGKGYSGRLLVKFPYTDRNSYVKLLGRRKGKGKTWDDQLLIEQTLTHANKCQSWSWQP